MPLSRDTLRRAKGTLGKLQRTANRLGRLTDQVRAALPEEIAPRVTVANWTPATLVLAAADPATATRLRFALPTVMERLSSLSDFAAIERTSVRVSQIRSHPDRINGDPGDAERLSSKTGEAPAPGTYSAANHRPLSQSAAEHLQAVAQRLTNLSKQPAAARLSAALRALADSASNSD